MGIYDGAPSTAHSSYIFIFKQSEKAVWILISWLLKPADQDLLCFLKSDISGFNMVRVNILSFFQSFLIGQQERGRSS